MNAPQGMAEGGLASLPVPDAMFDEPVDAQSFGGGGIVSFAGAGEVEIDPGTGLPIDRPPPEAPPQGLAAIMPPSVDPTLAYINRFKGFIDAGQGPDANKYSRMQAAQLEKDMSPAAQSAQKKQDLFMALAQIGSGMAASKNPSFFGSIGEATQAALPGVQRAAEARKATQSNAIKELAGNEKVARNERVQLVAGALAQQQSEIKNKADQDRFDYDVKHNAEILGVDKDRLKEDIRAHKASEANQAASIGATRDAANATRDLTQQNRESGYRNMAVDNVDKLLLAQAAADSDFVMPSPAARQRLYDSQYNFLAGGQRQPGIPGLGGGIYLPPGAPAPASSNHKNSLGSYNRP
jgi:hypothetical protein